MGHCDEECSGDDDGQGSDWQTGSELVLKMQSDQSGASNRCFIGCRRIVAWYFFYKTVLKTIFHFLIWITVNYGNIYRAFVIHEILYS